MTDLLTIPPPAAEAAAAVMAPGRYLQLRRMAAGFTLQHVVLSIVHSGTKDAADRRDRTRRALAALEADQLRGAPQVELVDRIGQVFSFDSGIYWLLVCFSRGDAQPAAIPQICRGCGCTWNDACDDCGQGCAWVPGDPTLCTVCHRDGPPLAGELGHA